jgi:hypothetical protein
MLVSLPHCGAPLTGTALCQAAAEAVAADPDVPAGEVAGHLGSLVDKSLVQFDDTEAGPGRYRLLDTVRQYAAGRLDAAGPAAANAARVAHRNYYVALAEAAAPQLVGPAGAEWLDRLDAELGNLRAAIAFTLPQPDPDPGLRLAAYLLVFWSARGHAAEAADALRALLDVPGAQRVTLARARALAAAGHPRRAGGQLRRRRGLLPGGARHCRPGRGGLPRRRAAASASLDPASPREARRRAAAHRAGPGPCPPPWGPPPGRPPAFRQGIRHQLSGGPCECGPRLPPVAAALPPNR